MTKEELKQIYYINREIKMWQKELDKIQYKSVIKGQEITGMPFCGGTSDSVGDMAVTITEIETIIKGLLAKLQLQKKNIIEYISSIQNAETRQIFFYRNISCMNWNQVAKEMGEGYTADGVRQRYCRYFKKNKSVTSCHKHM